MRPCGARIDHLKLLAIKRAGENFIKSIQQSQSLRLAEALPGRRLLSVFHRPKSVRMPADTERSVSVMCEIKGMRPKWVIATPILAMAFFFIALSCEKLAAAPCIAGPRPGTTLRLDLAGGRYQAATYNADGTVHLISYDTSGNVTGDVVYADNGLRIQEAQSGLKVFNYTYEPGNHVGLSSGQFVVSILSDGALVNGFTFIQEIIGRSSTKVDGCTYPTIQIRRANKTMWNVHTNVTTMIFSPDLKLPLMSKSIHADGKVTEFQVKHIQVNDDTK